MSVSVYVEAHRKVSETDMRYVAIYNALMAEGIEPPTEVVEYLKRALGDDCLFWDDETAIAIPPGDRIVAVNVQGEGNASYGSGMIIKVADLPPGTEILRIYME